MDASRTFIGSVVCVDLVGYSKRTVAQQGEIKKAFNKLLMQVLKRVPPEDRIILDTGDGAAISFLGDPEESLAIGLKLRDTLNGAADKLGGAEPDSGPVRIGINLGPLRVAVDMNGHPKIIGDGINVAEKICAFAHPGQIVVSRPFHDMVSRISDKHTKIFHYEGVRTDKNVRDHEIYSVIPAVAEVLGDAAKALKTNPPVPPKKPAAQKPEKKDEGTGEAWYIAFLRDPKLWGSAAAVLGVVIAIELSSIYGRMVQSAPADVAKVEPPKAEAPKVEPPKVEPPKLAEPVKMPEPPKAAPVARHEPPKIEKKPEPPKIEPPKIEKKAEPPKVEAPKIEKKAEPPKVETKKAPEPAREPPRKVEEPVRVIPPPRTPPAQVAPTTTPAAPSVQPTEPTPAIREEPKATPPPAPAPPTTVAIPLSRAPVNFPVAAVNRGYDRGSVRARVTISAQGTVKDVTILSANPSLVFNAEATRSLESWRFNAGADNRTYEVEIEFKR